MGQGRSEDASSNSAEENIHTFYGIGDFITFYTKKKTVIWLRLVWGLLY